MHFKSMLFKTLSREVTQPEIWIWRAGNTTELAISAYQTHTLTHTHQQTTHNLHR